MQEKDKWAQTPGPVRGEILRQIGVALREKKDAIEEYNNAKAVCIDTNTCTKDGVRA